MVVHNTCLENHRIINLSIVMKILCWSAYYPRGSHWLLSHFFSNQWSGSRFLHLLLRFFLVFLKLKLTMPTITATESTPSHLSVSSKRFPISKCCFRLGYLIAHKRNVETLQILSVYSSCTDFNLSFIFDYTNRLITF